MKSAGWDLMSVFIVLGVRLTIRLAIRLASRWAVYLVACVVASLVASTIASLVISPRAYGKKAIEENKSKALYGIAQMMTHEEELGSWLFSDKRLSGDNQTSCKSCHNPEMGWSDGRPKAIGFGGKLLNRRTPTLIGLGEAEKFLHPMFWDGRSQSLFDQAIMPIIHPDEMNQDLDELIQELSIPLYLEKFRKAYGEAKVSVEKIAQALVAFEKTIRAPDYLMRLEELNAGPSQIDNLEIFEGVRLFHRHCAICHRPGENFSDGQFHDIGLKESEDLGRASVVSRDSDSLLFRSNKFKFKTPTLWGVAQRGPYMHDGSIATLREVLEHYNNGGSFRGEEERRLRVQTLSPLIRPLNLTENEFVALEKFLTIVLAVP